MFKKFINGYTAAGFLLAEKKAVVFMTVTLPFYTKQMIEVGFGCKSFLNFKTTYQISTGKMSHTAINKKLYNSISEQET